MDLKCTITLFLMLVLVCVTEASGGRRYRRQQNQGWTVVPQQVVYETTGIIDSGRASPVAVGESCDDALAEVNAERAKRGLKAYINDPVLNKAAKKCAARRAAILCEGHCPESDFTYLDPVYPVGTCAGGCAAWEPSWGWGACCTYDNYTYCGAAWVMGSDGRRYMHLFVR